MAEDIKVVSVPGRECGDCTVCCVALTIDTPELAKLPQVVCQHCSIGGGCKIYDRRPAVCRDWYCGWRLLELSDEWRPDKSGVLIHLSKDGARNLEMNFELVGPLSAVLNEDFVKFIFDLIERKVKTFLLVPKGRGYGAGKSYLNDELAEAVAAKDYTAMLSKLMGGLEAAVHVSRERVILKNAPGEPLSELS